MMQTATPPSTEVVDKSLIERLILEHSDRLELEINHKARADAWKYYFRVRIDHVLRPFAVCKVCYRVLHCDSRSGTASLLRHPCNPLSERSPVNRAVKLNAKLKLPPDAVNNLFKKELGGTHAIKLENGTVTAIGTKIGQDGCGTPTTCPSPTSTSSPPATTAKKRKVGPPPPAFPLDMLQFPGLMAATAAANAPTNPIPHPLAALLLASAVNGAGDHFQQQLQQMQVENFLQLHQQQKLQQEQQRQQNSSPTHFLEDSAIKRWCGGNGNGAGGGGPSERKTDAACGAENNIVINKELVQHLININSNRVRLSERGSNGSAWSGFWRVEIDGVARTFAACRLCRRVVTYSRYTGTGGLIRHRCPHSTTSTDAHIARLPPTHSLTPPHDASPPPLVRPMELMDQSFSPLKVEISTPSSQSSSPSATASNGTVAGVARALLRYMCQELVPTSTIDSNGFQQLVTSLINLGASHGPLRETIPASESLLTEHLEPLAAESRGRAARLLNEQPHLCLSCHRPQATTLAVAAHYLTTQFHLTSHALGTRHIADTDSTEDALTALLSESLQESPSLLRERRLTVVSDEDDLGSMGAARIPCLWHATERTLGQLTELPAYIRVSNETTKLLEFLASSGVPGAGEPPPSNAPSWEALLHALTFVAVHYDQVVTTVRSFHSEAPGLAEQEEYQELANLLGSIRRCLLGLRATDRPTLNQAVLCRAKLVHLCTAPAHSDSCKTLQQQLLPLFQRALNPHPLHLVASFLDPRFKSLKVRKIFYVDVLRFII